MFSLPGRIDGKSKLSDVRHDDRDVGNSGIAILCSGYVRETFPRERFCVWDVWFQNGRETGKRFFSFIAVGLNLSNQEEKVAEKKAPVQQNKKMDLSSLTEAFRKKMVLDKSIHHDSIVSSCPAEFVPRFRPLKKSTHCNGCIGLTEAAHGTYVFRTFETFRESTKQ